jgi:hypothetical protein
MHMTYAFVSSVVPKMFCFEYILIRLFTDVLWMDYGSDLKYIWFRLFVNVLNRFFPL